MKYKILSTPVSFRTRGFTLVEVLVYIAVTVLIATAGVSMFLSLDTVLLRNATERALTHSATVSLERIARDIKVSTGVNTAQSTLGASPGVLSLNQAGTTTVFSVSGGNLIVAVNGTEIGSLTSEGVTVQSLVFTRYAGTVTELVRVALTLSVSSKAASSTRTFYTSAVLRDSYE